MFIFGNHRKYISRTGRTFLICKCVFAPAQPSIIAYILVIFSPSANYLPSGPKFLSILARARNACEMESISFCGSFLLFLFSLAKR